MNFQYTLQRLLDDRKMSVAKLSHQTGIPSKTIYHWLSGQQPRKMEHVFRICDLFNMSVEELYGRPPRENFRTLPSLNLEQELRAGIYEVILRPARK
jgi:transcriptional regulator with XRE-family HTH domain